MNDLYFLNGHCWFKDTLLILVSGKLFGLLLVLTVYLINLFLPRWVDDYIICEQRHSFVSLSLSSRTKAVVPSAAHPPQSWQSPSSMSAHHTEWTSLCSSPRRQVCSFHRVTGADRHFVTRTRDLSHHSASTGRFHPVPRLPATLPPSTPHHLPRGASGPPPARSDSPVSPGLSLGDCHRLPPGLHL